MAVFTQPPSLLAAAGRHLVRREVTVKGRMPLRRDHRLLGFQIIKSRQDLAVGAVRAIAPLVHTVGDDRTEGMSLVTEPPHGDWNIRSLPPVSAHRSISGPTVQQAADAVKRDH